MPRPDRPDSEEVELLELDEIHRRFRDGDREVYKFIERFLRDYPEDEEARLLKAEICLVNEYSAQYPYVQRLLETSLPDIYSDYQAQLQKMCDQLITLLLKRGQKYTGDGKINEAVEVFNNAIKLRPDDASMIFGCGNRLLQWSPPERFKRRTPEVDSRPSPFSRGLRFGRAVDMWQEHVSVYFRRVTELTTPEDILYENAVHKLSQHVLEWHGIQSEITELLLSIHNPKEKTLTLKNAILEQIAEYGFKAAETFLQSGHTRNASIILNRLKKIVPDRSGLHVMDAERHWQNDNLEKAARAYRRLLNPRQSSKTIDFADAHDLLTKLEKMKITCPQCQHTRRVTTHPPENILRCVGCATDLRQHELLHERYSLTDEDATAVAGYLGLAEIALQSDDVETTLENLEAVMDVLPSRHPAMLEVRLQRTRILQEDAEVHPGEKIINLVKTGGITEGIIYLIDQLNTREPAAWFDCAVASRLMVCRALMADGYLQEARAFLEAGFADNPDRKSVEDFAAELHKRIQDYATTLLNEARQALTENRPEDAARILTQAIDLTTENPELYLMRGDTRIKLGHDAPALDDLHLAIELTDSDAIQQEARKKIALLLEKRWDLDGARMMLASAGLDNDQVEYIHNRIERRRFAQPYIHAEPARTMLTDDRLTPVEMEGYTNAYFAIAVREISPPNHQGWNERLLNASFEFTQIMGTFRDTTLDVVFAMRFICIPYPAIPERGRITVALLVRITVPDESSYKEQALQVYQDIIACLPLAQENIYIFEPVVDVQELEYLLEPFEQPQIAEIVRRETDASRDGVYTVSPFTPGTLDMHNLFWTLLRQKSPAMVSIHLKPTRVYGWDRQIPIEGLKLQVTENDIPEDVVDPMGYLMEVNQNNRKIMETHQQHSIQMSYLDYAFILRLNVVGSSNSSNLLPYMAAAAFMGPLRNQGRNGGYEVMSVTSLEEETIARRNLRTIDVAHWGHTTAPADRVKLRYITGEGEATNLFRFPIPGPSGVPGMRVMEGRAVSPPAGMSATGTALGISTARGANAMPTKVMISDRDRRRHLYVVGKTGTGKSTLLSSIVLQDIHDGKAICLLDPHGDLVHEVLLRIPDYRMNDVILFDPSDQDYPIGLNVLNPENEDDKPRIANAFIALLQRMYDPQNQGITGPIFQSFVRNALLAVMSLPGSSLVDVYRLLIEPAYSKKFIPHISDPTVKTFWENESSRTNNSNWRQDLIPYLTSKFSRFVEDPVLRRIVGQSRNSINWFDAIQSRKIIMLDLAKGRIGAETSQFLGLLVLAEVLQASFKRGKLPMDQRRDFSIIIDEVQNYSTPLLSNIIAEGRKFGVSLTIANQYLHQLDNGLREAVFGNVGTIGAMRVGIDDAIMLAREFYPIFSADDLTNLPRFTAAIKLLVNDMASRPFTMRTLMPTDAPDTKRARYITGFSQQRYGTPIALIEKEIATKFD